MAKGKAAPAANDVKAKAAAPKHPCDGPCDGDRVVDWGGLRAQLTRDVYRDYTPVGTVAEVLQRLQLCPKHEAMRAEVLR